MNFLSDKPVPNFMLLLIIGLIDLIMFPNPSNASCAYRKQCCKGKDPQCFSFDWNISANKWKRCFCDEFCIKTKDCCDDYSSHCQVTPKDCEVSQWTAWGECTKKCGIGHTSRFRRIDTEPEFGGKRCPALKEMRTCVALSCPVKKSLFNGGTRIYRKLKEVGKIIPEEFSQWRDSKIYSIKKDIRKNIYWHFDAMNHVHKPTHCAHYIINSATAHCQLGYSATWSRRLLVGRRICVACHNTVMEKDIGDRCRGIGVYNEKSRWKAVGIPHCHGVWTMITIPQKCDCSTLPSVVSYTFV